MANPKISNAKLGFSEELEAFKEYLKSTSSEKAKNHLLYPLFRKLFKEGFKIETDAQGADVYIEGQLIVEAKSTKDQWLDGFFQALHYQRKFGLTYNTIMVVAQKFVAIWKLDKLPEYAVVLKNTSNPAHAPNVVGKENAKRSTAQNAREIRDSATYWLEPKDLEGQLFKTGTKSLTVESYEILKILRNLQSSRQQVNTHNFIDCIERMKPLFPSPIEAVHAFYSILSYWDITSTVAVNEETGEVRVIGYSSQRFSEPVPVPKATRADFKRMVEAQYIFTNEGSGLSVDYYFSRFDEVMARIDPAYVKQHGIFFTDGNLSKFALWYAKHHFPGKIDEDYIVFDPAGGSGNLVSSWRGKLKHKIVSELQPDLLRTIERRMKADPFHYETGFTIVPKTSTNKGLNFLDRSAADYLGTLEKELKLKNLNLDKPIAFLLNPPYKNTDENQKEREATDAHYGLHPDILKLTGEDAGKERYLAFLGQILLMAREQRRNLTPALSKGEGGMQMPIVMIFTPTSWLIPRPTYKAFREKWDAEFAYHSGFIVTSNEFFKLEGKWPLAFTIWHLRPQPDEAATNTVRVQDLTHLNRQSLNISWGLDDGEIAFQLQGLYKEENTVVLDNSRGQIKDWVGQKMYDFKRDPTKEELKSKEIFGGLPLKDERRENKKTYGIANSEFIGFMDDATPVRVKGSNNLGILEFNNSIWFRLDTVFVNLNQTKVFGGPTDNRSYCSFDFESSKTTFSWYSLTKVLNGNYPIWANQFNVWPIDFSKKPELEQAWYSLCFAFVLAENRCVVTKFEVDNPVAGAPEVFVNNPLCPTLAESFWAKTLDKEVVGSNPATQLVKAVKDLYQLWNRNYCKGQWLTDVGLKNEPYFRYFAYSDFLTPHSGLIQIRKYAEQENLPDLLDGFKEISVKTKVVKEEMYKMLVGEFGYFN
jgi:hypothetical protein